MATRRATTIATTKGDLRAVIWILSDDGVPSPPPKSRTKRVLRNYASLTLSDLERENRTGTQRGDKEKTRYSVVSTRSSVTGSGRRPPMGIPRQEAGRSRPESIKPRRGPTPSAMTTVPTPTGPDPAHATPTQAASKLVRMRAGRHPLRAAVTSNNVSTMPATKPAPRYSDRPTAILKTAPAT